jgi:translation elongation factor P/translation initiation factor 5A
MSLKDVISSSMIVLKPPASEIVDKVDLTEKVYEFLYQEGDIVYLQDKESFESSEVPKALFTDQAALSFVECNLKYACRRIWVLILFSEFL